MRVIQPDAATFEERTRTLLLADEARHNLILGLLGALRRHPDVYPDHGLWLVEGAGGTVVGAALRTRPFRLVLARSSEDAVLEALAAAIDDDDLPGVVGALPEVESFARAWAKRRGVAVRVSMAQGIYALERLVPPPAPPGAARPATADDRALLLEWQRQFSREAVHGPELDEERLARTVDHHLRAADAGYVLWETDCASVSFAGFGGQTPSGVRIGPVYTPPQHRGRGYGTAVTAAVSAERLAAGRRFCFLYTDLSNPTSNSIYARIGYRLVCESREVDFGPRPA